MKPAVIAPQVRCHSKRVLRICHTFRWTGGWTPVLVFNTFIVLYFTTVGFGIGGYASIKTFVDKIRTLGVFVDCYQCKKG